MKIRRNHSKPIEFEVHPFVEVVYTQSGVLIEGIHVVWRCTPLKMTRHCSFVPTALMHSIIDTHSRDSGEPL